MSATAKRYGISRTTVQKWRARETTADAAMGPKEPRSTSLTPEEEAVIAGTANHIVGQRIIPTPPTQSRQQENENNNLKLRTRSEFDAFAHPKYIEFVFDSCGPGDFPEICKLIASA